MKKFCLFGFIFLVNILLTGNVFAQDPPPRKGVTVSSPSGLKPRPDDIPLPNPNRVNVNDLNAGREIPDHVVYEMVFRLAKMGWGAAEELKFNPYEVVCKQYRMEKVLNDKQEKVLNEISAETLIELEKLNQQAKPIIDEFRAKMRSGMIVQNGERPMPPPELAEISEKKIKLIEDAIEKLKKNLGTKDFAGLNDFVNRNLRSKMKSGPVPTPIKRGTL